MQMEAADEYFSTDPGIPFHLLKWTKTYEKVNESLSVDGLQDSLSKFNEKNVDLSSFLPHLPGYIDAKSSKEDSLQMLVERPPVGGRELAPLSESALQSFRLMPGSVPDQYKFVNKPPEKKKKKKHKRAREVEDNSPLENTDRKHKKRKKDEGPEKKKKEKKKKKKKEKDKIS